MILYYSGNGTRAEPELSLGYPTFAMVSFHAIVSGYSALRWAGTVAAHDGEVLYHPKPKRQILKEQEEDYEG